MEKVIGTGWKYQPVPKGLPPYVSVEASLVPAEKPGVLSRGQWSWLRGTGWETGAFGLSQPVPKARFLVVTTVSDLIHYHVQLDPETHIHSISREMLHITEY